MSRTCRFCGRAYEPESFEDKNLDMGGWTDRYSNWSGRYCLPCAEAAALDERMRYNRHNGKYVPCLWCGKNTGCNCAVFYGGLRPEPIMEREE